MTIKYTIIVKNNKIINTYPKNVDPIIKNTSMRIIENLSNIESTKVSYNHKDLTFHVMIKERKIFLCATEKDLGNRIPFNYLKELAKNKKSLKDLEKFYSNKDNDKIHSVKNKINDVKETMLTNIDKVLERGNDINNILDETEHLMITASEFNLKGRKLKNTMWWRNFKLWIIIITIMIIIIFTALIGFVLFYVFYIRR